MNRIDKFVGETSIIWFFILLYTVGFIGWLVTWALYELLMAVFAEEEKPKKKSKAPKMPKTKPPKEACVDVETQTEKVYI